MSLCRACHFGHPLECEADPPCPTGREQGCPDDCPYPHIEPPSLDDLLRGTEFEGQVAEGRKQSRRLWYRRLRWWFGRLPGPWPT